MFKKTFLTLFIIFCLVVSGWCVGKGTNFHNADINNVLNYIFNVQADFQSVLIDGTLSFEGATANDYETSIAITDPTADRTVTIADRTGTVTLQTAPVALTPGGAVTLTIGVGQQIYTDTPTDNEDQTITFSGAGTAGDVVRIIFTTTGTADEVITFHATLVSSTGTLTCGTTAARYYVVTFVSNGSHWYEVSRTAVQT